MNKNDVNIEYLIDKIKRGVILNYHEFSAPLSVNITEPSIYIFRNKTNNKIEYVGETMDPRKRFISHEHYKNHEIVTFSSQYFHKSAIYDIETRMIRLFKSYEPTMNIGITNRKTKQADYEYFTKSLYNDIDRKIWDRLLERGLVSNDYDKVANSEVYKWSPYVSPNLEQSLIVEEVLKKVAETGEINYCIEGAPGTGKTTLAINLAHELCDDPRVSKIYFYSGNPQTKNSFENIFVNHEKIEYASVPKILSNEDDNAIIIVDEAQETLHKQWLVTSYGMRCRNRRRTVEVARMLEADFDSTISAINDRFKKSIFLFDSSQSTSPDSVDVNKLIDSFAKESITKNLVSSMRVDKAWIAFVNYFLYDIEPDERFEEMEFEIQTHFQNAMELVSDMSNVDKKSLNVLMSSYAYEWKSKNENVDDFDLIGLKGVRWANPKQQFDKWITSENARNFKEVAYYKKLQGFEVDNGALIFPSDLIVDNGVLRSVPDLLKERKIPSSELPLSVDRNDPDDADRYEAELTEVLKNRYYVLLTRSRDSLRIYFEDASMNEYFNKKLDMFKNKFIK